jgi:hypothetical protein
MTIFWKRNHGSEKGKKELRLFAFKVHSFISNKILKPEGAKLVNNNNETKKFHPTTLKAHFQFFSKLDDFNQLN